MISWCKVVFLFSYVFFSLCYQIWTLILLWRGGASRDGPHLFHGQGSPFHDLVLRRWRECNPQPLTFPLTIPSWTALNTEREQSADWVSLATNDAWVLSFEFHRYSDSAIADHRSILGSCWLTLLTTQVTLYALKTGRFPGACFLVLIDQADLVCCTD